MEHDRIPYASLGRRLAGHLLDGVVSLVPVILAGVALRIMRLEGAWAPAGAGPGEELNPEEFWRSMGGVAKLCVIVNFLIATGPVYRALFESSSWQASFGKRLMNIYVTDDEGARIRIVRSIARSVARLVFNLFCLAPVSVISILATGKRKALHDFAAKTLVLRGRPSPGGALEPWRIIVAFGVPFFWTLATFLLIL